MIRIFPVGNRSNQAGFTYSIVLVMAVIVGILAEVATSTTATVMQREAEEELLFRGMAYVNAIGDYYRANRGMPTYPSTLDDLLRDPRYPNRRYIRKLYADPFGSTWRILRNDRGNIVGVATSSHKVPFKKGGFPNRFKYFASAKQLRDWEFIFLPNEINTETETSFTH